MQEEEKEAGLVPQNGFLQGDLSVEAIDRYIEQDLGDVSEAIRERYKEMLLDLMFGEKRLQDIPELFRRPIACAIGVRNYPADIEYVPGEFITPDMMRYVLRKTENMQIFEKIPKSALTMENCLAALDENVYLLPYIPKKFLSTDICIDVVKTAPELYTEIPMSLVTEEMRQIVLQNMQNSDLIQSEIGIAEAFSMVRRDI